MLSRHTPDNHQEAINVRNKRYKQCYATRGNLQLKFNLPWCALFLGPPAVQCIRARSRQTHTHTHTCHVVRYLSQAWVSSWVRTCPALYARVPSLAKEFTCMKYKPCRMHVVNNTITYLYGVSEKGKRNLGGRDQTWFVECSPNSLNDCMLCELPLPVMVYLQHASPSCTTRV